MSSEKNIKEIGLGLIDKIYDTRLKLLELRGEIDEREHLLETIKQGEMNLIARAKDHNGKKKFSNKASRESELTMRLERNEEYQESKDKKEDLEYEFNVLNFELEKLKNKFDLYKRMF